MFVMMMEKGEEKLEIALSSFLNGKEIISPLSQVLSYASKIERVSYGEIKEMVNSDVEDILLLSSNWGLLFPINEFTRGVDWDNGTLLAEQGEIYAMPNIIRCMIENASETGEWNLNNAVEKIFKEMSEPDWENMPRLVRRLKEEAENGMINSIQIKKICNELGLEEKVDPLIAELKASGIMSPKISYFEVIRIGLPIYKINPVLFKERRKEGNL